MIEDIGICLVELLIFILCCFPLLQMQVFSTVKNVFEFQNIEVIFPFCCLHFELSSFTSE